MAKWMISLAVAAPSANLFPNVLATTFSWIKTAKLRGRHWLLGNPVSPCTLPRSLHIRKDTPAFLSLSGGDSIWEAAVMRCKSNFFGRERDAMGCLC